MSQIFNFFSASYNFLLNDWDSVNNESSNERWEEIIVWNEYNYRDNKIVQSQMIKEDKVL